MGFKDSRFFGIILNLLLPGLGHLFWRELVFSIFVFLVVLIGAVLFFVSFLVPLSIWVKLFLFGLPLLFYIFTFFDLERTIKTKRALSGRSKRTMYIFLLVGIAYQLFSPLAPVNFLIRNLPEIYKQQTNSVSPLHSRGDLLIANRMDYIIDLFFISRPVIYALPERYDIVRFRNENGNKETGLVIGLPGEQVEVIDGTVVTNGLIDWDGGPIKLNGQTKLTTLDRYYILIVTLEFGSISKTHEIPLDQLIGKVSEFP